MISVSWVARISDVSHQHLPHECLLSDWGNFLLFLVCWVCFRHETQQTHVQRLSPKSKGGLTLCTLARRLQKQKARSNPDMVIFNFNFIGYFILVLQNFPPPDATWPSPRSDFSGFISLLCHPCLPAALSGLRPSLFSSDPPPCYTHTHTVPAGVMWNPFNDLPNMVSWIWWGISTPMLVRDTGL
jgi:hypothetical protein